jgi:hypothetical protein
VHACCTSSRRIICKSANLFVALEQQFGCIISNRSGERQDILRDGDQAVALTAPEKWLAGLVRLECLRSVLPAHSLLSRSRLRRIGTTS